MYRMDYSITVGALRLPLLTSVKIKKDVESLMDTATIVAPAVAHGKALAYAKVVALHQPVSIMLGYDGQLSNEFSGYVSSVVLEDNMLTIECEDALHLMRLVPMPDGQLKGVTVTSLLQQVVAKTNAYCSANGIAGTLTLNCLYSYSYTTFNFVHATAYDVMEKIQKEGKPNIDIKDGVLRVFPQYTSPDGIAVYSLASNICKEGLKLKWRSVTDRKLLVIAKSKGKNGVALQATAGVAGGDTQKIDFSGIYDLASLQRIANETYNHQCFTGYEGSFCSWLVPFVDANYQARIIDESGLLQNGSYYVKSVETEFSSSGGIRTISLGAGVP